MSAAKEALARQTAEQHLIGLWEIFEMVEHASLQNRFRPHAWSWTVIEPLLREAARSITLADATRRVIICSNPGAAHRHHSTNTLYLSCSIYNPGERAPAHRHTANASRFVLQGNGGYTNIEGEKCTMERGDLIVTPAGTWHDHGNEGSEPVMWVDVLDLPLVENMSASVFDNNYLELTQKSGAAAVKVRRANQSVVHPQGHSTNLYATGGLVPAFANHVRGEGTGTPMFVYRWKDAKEALNRLRHLPGSPHDGIILEYVNPVDGGPVTTTMGFTVQLLRPGEATRSHRQRSSAAYCCLEGHGETIVGDSVLRWGPNDLFVVPSWMPHSHINGSKTEDAVLYAVTDVPALKKLGLYREEDVE